MAETEPVVYFVKAGHAVKIGFSANLPFRLREIAAMQAEPITVLGIKLGGRTHEAELHRRLSEYRLNGEWFRDCPEVRAQIGEGLFIELPPPPEPKVKKPRPNIAITYTPRPPSPWMELSGRVKRLDDAMLTLGYPVRQSRILHRTLSQFADLFEKSIDDESPELLAEARTVVQNAEHEITL
jgi:hypothetical protein